MTQRKILQSSVFPSLLEQLESTENGAVYLSKAQLEAIDPSGALRNSGLIENSQPLTDVICDGCDWRCPKPVKFRYNSHGMASAAFVACDEREGMGNISIGLDLLEMYALTFRSVAEWLAQMLSVGCEPREIEPESLFHIGAIDRENNQCDLFLVRGINRQNTIAQHLAIQQSARPILITLALPKSKPPVPFVALHSLISCKGRNIILSKELPTPEPLQKRTGKRGAKPQHDWPAYQKQFDELIEHYGLPGVDQPELKNQAAIEKRLSEWGEHTFDAAPSPARLRSYISQWLKEVSARN